MERTRFAGSIDMTPDPMFRRSGPSWPLKGRVEEHAGFTYPVEHAVPGWHAQGDRKKTYQFTNWPDEITVTVYTSGDQVFSYTPTCRSFTVFASAPRAVREAAWDFIRCRAQRWKSLS